MPTFPELKGRVSLDGKGFEQTLGRLKGQASAFAGSLKGLLAAGFSTAVLTAQAKKTAEYASRIWDLSEATQSSAEWLQSLDYAATQGGTSLEKLVAVQQKLAKARAEALGNPGGEQARAFEQLGFSRERLEGLSKAPDLMREFSSEVKRTNLDLNSVPIILSLIGEKNYEVLPALAMGLAEAAAEAQGLGLVMSSSVAKSLDEVTDKIAVMEKQLTIGLAPALVQIGNLFTEVIGGAKAGFAFLEGFMEKIAILGFDAPIKTAIPAAIKAGNEAAQASVLQTMAEQAAIAGAQATKAKARGLAVDDLSDVKGPGVGRMGKLDFDVDKPAGFGAGGGFSQGFLSGYNPADVVNKAQLEALNEIKRNVERSANLLDYIKNHADVGSPYR